MRSLGKLIAHIPARGGSKRVPAKNLRYLCAKPMIAYAIDCARASKVFDEIYVNTDSDTIAALAEACGVKVYRRPAELGSDTATGDDFTADFMRALSPDTLLMVSPVCPLVEPSDVRLALEAYQESDCDTLITCQNTQMQTFCDGAAVNIDPSGPLAPSQENRTVQILNWAVTIWDTRVFLESYAKTHSGYIGSRRLLHPIAPLRSLKISHEEDFRVAELLLHAKGHPRQRESLPRYWTTADGTPWNT